MRKLFLFTSVAVFGLAACNKNEAVLDNTPAKQKAPKEIVYFDNVNKEVAEGAALAFYTGIEGNNKDAAVAELDSILDWEGKTAMYIFNLKHLLDLLLLRQTLEMSQLLVIRQRVILAR
jgi:hypothetical protein